MKEEGLECFDQRVGSLSKQKFVRIPRDGADQISRKVVRWHLASFLINDVEVKSVHGFLKPIQRFGMHFAEFL